MPTYSYTCLQCDTGWEATVPIAERDHQFCTICRSGNIRRHLAAPSVMNASYPDGTRRFGEHREALKLHTEAARSSGEKKREIEKEIRKLGVRVNKPIV